MPSAAVIARIVLAVAFLLSASTKLLDRQGSRDAAAGLGVPERFARPVGVVLPFAELTTVALLLPGATAWAGLVLAGLLLVAFTAVLVANLVKGQRPPCRCFGQLSEEPISWVTVVRNGLLLSLVGLGSTGGDPVGVLVWLDDRSSSSLGLVAMFLSAAIIALFAFATRARALPAAEQTETQPLLQEGDPAPTFTLTALSGADRSLDEFLVSDDSLLIVFSDPGCGPCNELVPQLDRWRSHHASHLRVIYLSTGTQDDVRAKADEHGLDPSVTLLLDGDFSVPDAYQFRGTPSAALVAPDGTLAGPIASGSHDISELLQRAEQHRPVPTEAAELVIGDPAPPFHLHAIDGAHLDLAVLQGQMTLFVFWDPTCSFCGTFLDDFRAMEGAIAETGMRVVVVSSGDGGMAERSLPWPYAVDPDRVLALEMGVTGTPMARLVDAEGRIASDIAVGADEIVALVERMAFLGSVAAGVGRPQTS